MDRLPIFMGLDGRRCLVVGGGLVAERKIRILRRTGAKITVVSPWINDYLGELVARGELEHVDARYRSEHVHGYWLVIAATDDPDVNRQVSEDCEALARPCNVVDDNALSSFILPAIVDRSPVVVAIGTGGAAPVLAQQLKSRIEAMLPSRIGELAKEAARWRGLVKKRFSSGRLRLRFWQDFFDGAVARLFLAGRRKEAEQLIRRELLTEAHGDEKPKGEGWIVGAGPGDPSLVTLRAQQLIRTADVVLYDRLVSAPVLDFARKDAELIHVGKSPDSATNSQDEINRLLVRLVAEGNRVCRLKGGDPFVFGRGGEEIKALKDAGLPFQVVPGISAALGCAAYAGIPLTYRGISGSVTFATARLDKDLSPDWPALLNSGHTLCLYMGVGAIGNVSEQLQANGVSGDLPVAFVERGTTPEQRVVSSSVATMVDDARRHDIEAPAIVYIGAVTALMDDLAWFEGADAQAEIGVRDGLRLVEPAAGLEPAAAGVA
ncbi:MAG: siroheme synthase CysG [Pseudomonadota bacterium]